MPDRLRKRSLTVQGIRTRVIAAGPADASEAILLLHGNPGSAEDWAFVQPRIAEAGPVIAFDLPGYGKAERPRRWEYSPASYAAFIEAALRVLGIERVHLVLHDLGGLALLWAVNHPERFASATLINTGNLIDFRWHRVARLYRAPVLGKLLVALGTRPLFRAALSRPNAQPRPLPSAVVDRICADYDRGTRRAAMRFYRATPAEAMGILAPMLQPLDRPALVIWGGHDPFIAVEQAERQRQSFPSARIIVFEDSGHWPHIDDPDRTVEAVLPFLKLHLDAPRLT